MSFLVAQKKDCHARNEKCGEIGGALWCLGSAADVDWVAVSLVVSWIHDYAERVADVFSVHMMQR